MSDSRNIRGGRKRRPSNSYITKSGNKLRLNRNFAQRMKANRAARKEQKALYLSTLPKNRWKRLLYRMHPKRVARYWFSREGGIMTLKIAGIGIVVVFFLLLGAFAYFRKDLPQLKDLSGDTFGGSITYYDRTGKTVLWQDYDAVKRIPVPKDDMSKYMKQATVAIEDKNFYHEGAFSVSGIMRAGLHDVFGGGSGVQGGSTITQQLVKLNENWTDNRTITRKVKELIIAVELEREYSKDDILAGYLNIAPYGGVEYGCESAARDYFHTSCKDLSLAQAAMLASIPQAPTAYSPYSSPTYNKSVSGDYFNRDALIARQHTVLNNMVQQGYISQAQADAAKKVNILAQIHQLTPKYQGIKAPYFVLAAKQELEQKYGASTVQRGGWKVITTLDLNQQNEAEQLVQQNLPAVQAAGGDEEATVVEDVKTGQITSLVGGVDFSNPDHGQVNYAAGALVEPGSSFKPYDYAAFINNNTNVGAGSVLYDSPDPLPGYPCTNHSRPESGGNCLFDDNRTFPGPEPIRYALGGSRNVPAVKAMLSAVPNDKSSGRTDSVNKVISTATAMMDNPYVKGNTYNCYANDSLTQTTQCYGSSAIGSGELQLDNHTNGLATFARLGDAIPKTYILKITDAGGKVIDQFKQPKGKQVIDPQTAYIVNNMLSDPNASYFNYSAKFQHWNGWDFALKTGTSENNRDFLMVGYSTQYAMSSWIGYHTREKSMVGSSDALTYPLAHGLMTYLHKNMKPVNWKEPKGIQHLPVYVMRSGYGDMFGAIFPSPSTDLFPSWYKPPKSGGGTQVIDKVSNKLATSCTPADAQETVGNANANAFSVDIFHGGGPSGSTTVTGNDDVHHCDDALPTITLTAPSVCDGNSGGCDITVTASQGTHPLYGGSYTAAPAGTIDVSINGNSVHTFSMSGGNPYSGTFHYNPTSSGSMKVVATVTDSVLYQNSDGKTVNFTQGGGGTTQSITITNPSNGSVITGHSLNVQWTGGSGNYTASVSGTSGGFTGTCTSGSNSCTIDLSGAPSGAYTVTVSDDSGDSSPTVNFTKS
ncbi:MAG TPA: penicillin-binding protein [Candidatus Saccharimonadales bacterium]|nr:penicillin-binding protein [Candidatus Saccharimonadales bacterium]